jgi:hypothetical protein
MKRYGNIYDSVYEIENIKRAIQYASKRKRNRKAVQIVLNNQDYYVTEIRNMLINQTYTPSPYKEFHIKDGASQKDRTIYCPKFYPDQIIHWCLMLQIQSVLGKGMYEFCCASVPKRGTHYGKKYLRKWLDNDHKNTKYCLKLDISKYYPSINKDVLKTMFERKFKDKRLLWLIHAIIDSHYQGLPIGNYTSQWFANFYLQDIDHTIKEKYHVKHYMRYMDDMVLLGNNKKELHKVKNSLDILLKPMGLKLKSNWQVFRVDKRDIDFLGFRFYRNKTILRKRNTLRIRRRIQKTYKKPKIEYKDASAIISYLGWIKHSNSHKYYEKYIKPYINIKALKKVIKNESKK